MLPRAVHATSPPSSSRWLQLLTGRAAAALGLAFFYALLLASNRETSATFDEPGHGAAGYSYWKTNDYRLDPENGNLP